jgi:hypothetical protein
MAYPRPNARVGTAPHPDHRGLVYDALSRDRMLLRCPLVSRWEKFDRDRRLLEELLYEQLRAGSQERMDIDGVLF